MSVNLFNEIASVVVVKIPHTVDRITLLVSMPHKFLILTVYIKILNSDIRLSHIVGTESSEGGKKKKKKKKTIFTQRYRRGIKVRKSTLNVRV